MMRRTSQRLELITRRLNRFDCNVSYKTKQGDCRQLECYTSYGAHKPNPYTSKIRQGGSRSLSRRLPTLYEHTRLWRGLTTSVGITIEQVYTKPMRNIYLNDGAFGSARLVTRSRTTYTKTLLKQAVQESNAQRTGTKAHETADSQAREVSWPDSTSSLPFFVSVFAGICMASYVVPTYAVELVACEGPSMMPTISPLGDFVLVEKLSHRFYGLTDGACAEERILAEKERQRMKRRQLKRTRIQNKTKELKKHQQTDNHILLPKRSNSSPRAFTEGSVSPPASEAANQREANWAIQKLFDRIFSPLRHGDIVIARHPIKSQGTVCKRILALPGDTVIKRERVHHYKILHIGDNDDDDGGNIICTPSFRDADIINIPDGHVWLEGDNPENSRDSREYGPVPFALVQGRTILRIWPLRGNALFGLERRAKKHVGRKTAKGKQAGVDENDHYEDLRSRVIPAGRQ